MTEFLRRDLEKAEKRILDRIRDSWYNRTIEARRRAPEESKMEKNKVTITYLDGRVSRGGRYGASQHVETVLRWCNDEELDEVIKHFRLHYGIVPIEITR